MCCVFSAHSNAFCSLRNSNVNNESDFFPPANLWQSYINTPYTHTTFYSEEVSGMAMHDSLMTFYFPLSVSPSVTYSSHHSCHGDSGCMKINRKGICWTWRMMKIDFIRHGLVNEWCWWSHTVVVEAACSSPPARLTELFPASLPERSGSGPGRKGHSC